MENPLRLIPRFGILCVIWASAVVAEEPKSSSRNGPFSFLANEYRLRFEKDGMLEYTPTGQEDLERWTDMLTVNHYPQVTSPEMLANAANTVLGNYKNAGGAVVRTTSKPSTKTHSAEHLIVVMFARPGFVEVAFNRFRMLDGKGLSMTYSRRAYGNDQRSIVGEWVAKNGAEVERRLLSFELPQPAEQAKMLK